MYGTVQLHTSGRYNKRWDVTKSKRYKNLVVRDLVNCKLTIFIDNFLAHVEHLFALLPFLSSMLCVGLYVAGVFQFYLMFSLFRRNSDFTEFPF